MIRFYGTTANDRAYGFLLDAETILRDLVGQIIAKLEANAPVVGVGHCQPTNAVFLKDKRDNPVQICELTATVRCRGLR